MKRENLKWFLLVIALYLFVGLACFNYGVKVKKHAILHKIDIISENVTRGLYSADLYIKTVQDCNNTAAVSFSSFRFHTDKEKISKVLNSISSNEKVEKSIVCDFNGVGYDEKCESIVIKGTKMFNQIMDEYAHGGNGFVLVNEDNIFKAKSIVMVNQIKFADDVKGYLITDVYIDDLENRVLPGLSDVRKKGLIGFDGIVVAGENTGQIFWDDLSNLIPIDSIKMSISQNRKYIYEYENNSFVVLIPSFITSGGVILMIDGKTTASMVHSEMLTYNLWVFSIMVIMTLFFVLIILIHNLGGYLRKVKASHMDYAEANLDSVSGLYSEEGLREAIDNYAKESVAHRGVLFGVYIDDLSRNAEKSGGSEIDKRIRDFSEKLSAKYRMTDYLARGRNGEFFVFLRGISDDNDIRKQTDDLQLFLHDIKIDNMSENRKVSICTGRALLPVNGKNSEELLATVRKQMELSKMRE